LEGGQHYNAVDDVGQNVYRAALVAALDLQNAILKVYKGAPHGLCSTHKEQVNEDLLAFIKG
jgi:non-heme chloroperoxidase